MLTDQPVGKQRKNINNNFHSSTDDDSLNGLFISQLLINRIRILQHTEYSFLSSPNE